MSTRLATGGRLIDRSTRAEFTFNGKRMSGHMGDTLASALLANDQMLVGRSFKYHRPRGIVAAGPEEPNALVNLGRSDRMEPNQRATTTELFAGLESSSQNHWPSLEFDVGVANNYVSRFLPAGFYYKTFIYPRAAWKHVFEPIIRQSAGLGSAPKEPDADRYEYVYAFCDLLIIGGGIAGLQAALTAGQAGKRVMVLEQTAHWGGRAIVDGDEVENETAEEWVTWGPGFMTMAMCWRMSVWPITPRWMAAQSSVSGAFGPVISSRPRARLNVRFPLRAMIFRA
jgi:sarcosine oxidase, subunit alpha